MTKLQWLEIANFRGVSHLRYEPKQVNLLIGRNNAGKSTVLDAIEYSLTGNPFSDADTAIYNVKMGESLAEIKSDMHKLTLYKENTKLPDALQSRVDAILESAVMKACHDMDIEDSLFQDIYLCLRNKAVKFTTIYDGDLSIAFDDTELLGPGQRLTELQKLLEISLDPKKKNSGMPTESDDHTRKNNPGNGDYAGNILPHGTRDRGNSLRLRMLSVKFMSIITEYVNTASPVNRAGVIRVDGMEKNSIFAFDDDVRVIEMEEMIKEYEIIPNLERLTSNGVVYRSASGVRLPLPYTMHGEGLQTLLRILYKARNAENRVLLIEEPENHMHPGYLRIFVEQIMLLAEKLRIQVFMTSHSYDLIEGLANYPENAVEEDMIQITNVVVRDGQHELYSRSPSEVLNTLNSLKIDLRGT